MAGVRAGTGGAPDGGAAVVLSDVYGEHFDRVVGWFVRRTGNRALAEDLAQDTFERFARALDGVDGSRPTWPYLHAVAANVLIDHVRRADRQVVVPIEVVATGLPEVPVGDEQVVLKDLLGRGLEGLSQRQRVAVELQYERGWSVEESAAFLGVTALSFRQLSWRGRQKLRTWLEQVDDTLRGAVVPVGVGVRARWRSWTAKTRDLVSGPAPVLSIDAVSSILVAAVVGLSTVVASSSTEVSAKSSPTTLDVVRAPLTLETSSAPLEPTNRDADPRERNDQTRAEDGRRPTTPDQGRTTVAVPTVADAEGSIEVGESEDRWSLTQELVVQTEREEFRAGGDLVSVDCGNFVGALLCDG